MAGLEQARPQRADARRNRERIMDAARELFAESGVEAQMDEVAQRAGVGVGTVYRHFPTKDELHGALIAQRFAQFVAIASEEREREDPWEALETCLRRCAEIQANDLGACHLVSRGAVVLGLAEAERSALYAVTEELVERARDAGAVRADASADDVPVMMCALSAVASAGKPWERLLQLVLDGLRAK